MDKMALGWATFTGVVASVCVAVSLTWWSDPLFGYRSDDAVVAVAFLCGLVGWILMIGLLLSQGTGPGPVLVEFFATWKNPRFLLLWGWLALLAVVAVRDGIAGANKAGKWGADPPFSRPGCHWPLSANHDTEHLCVSHARWLAVNLATARIFVGFGTVFLVISCAAFTTLSRQFRRTRKTRAPRVKPRQGGAPTPRRAPFPYPSGGSRSRAHPSAGTEQHE